MVLAFSAGGTIDALGRILAQKLSERWGQSVIVDNRGGAAGNLGAIAAAQAPPDGSTIHLGAQSLATNVTMAPVPNFDPRRDLEPVIAVATAQDVLMVPPDSPAHSLPEWIAYAKAHPGELNYASLGTGSSGHLATVLFAQVTGLRLEHVPYTSISQAVTDIVAGRTRFGLRRWAAISAISSPAGCGRWRSRAGAGAVLTGGPNLRGRGCRFADGIHLVRHLRAPGHAQADHRHAQPRHGAGAGRARHARARRPARLSPDRWPTREARRVAAKRDRQMGRSREDGGFGGAVSGAGAPRAGKASRITPPRCVNFLFPSVSPKHRCNEKKSPGGTSGCLEDFIALLSAATFAFNNASVRRGVLTGSVLQAMAITVPIGLPISFLVAVVTGSLAAVAGFSSRALVALSLSGIMHFVWGRYCNYRATRAIGTNLVAPIQQINLIFTLLLAIWILGETLTPLRVLGIALVLLGSELHAARPRR